ncbi:MAG: hypothetical protein V3V47_01865 [Desulfobacteria bacterium]
MIEQDQICRECGEPVEDGGFFVMFCGDGFCESCAEALREAQERLSEVNPWRM